MLTKRLFLYRLNVDLCLARRWVKGGWELCQAKGLVHMWTFTLKTVESSAEFARRWNKLNLYLKRALPGWSGIRTFELHPGKWGEFSHGLHCHFVTGKRFPIRSVLPMAEAAGWGRVDVTLLPSEARYYAAKYLSKKRPACMKGMRLMACIGMADDVRARQVGIDSMRSKCFRQCQASSNDTYRKPWSELSWPEKLHAVNALEWSVHVSGLVWSELRCRFQAPERAGHEETRALRRGVNVPLLDVQSDDLDAYTAQRLRSGLGFRTILNSDLAAYAN